MKTKSLILTALLTVAGTAGLMAQSSNVYSQNIVGYVSQVIPQGYSILGNQINASPDNKVTTLFGNTTPDQTTIFKFNHATGAYTSLQYYDFGGGTGGWYGDDDQMTLNPGEAVFFYSATKFTNTVVGEVKLASTNVLRAGYQIVGSVLPMAGDLAGANMNFPKLDTASIFQFNSATGAYVSDQYYDLGGGSGGWYGDTTTGVTGPAVSVGQGYFVYVPSDVNWTQTLSVGP